MNKPSKIGVHQQTLPLLSLFVYRTVPLISLTLNINSVLPRYIGMVHLVNSNSTIPVIFQLETGH